MALNIIDQDANSVGRVVRRSLGYRVEWSETGDHRFEPDIHLSTRAAVKRHVASRGCRVIGQPWSVLANMLWR